MKIKAAICMWSSLIKITARVTKKMQKLNAYKKHEAMNTDLSFTANL